MSSCLRDVCHKNTRGDVIAKAMDDKLRKGFVITGILTVTFS